MSRDSVVKKSRTNSPASISQKKEQELPKGKKQSTTATPLKQQLIPTKASDDGKNSKKVQKKKEDVGSLDSSSSEGSEYETQKKASGAKNSKNKRPEVDSENDSSDDSDDGSSDSGSDDESVEENPPSKAAVSKGKAKDSKPCDSDESFSSSDDSSDEDDGSDEDANINRSKNKQAVNKSLDSGSEDESESEPEPKNTKRGPAATNKPTKKSNQESSDDDSDESSSEDSDEGDDSDSEVGTKKPSPNSSRNQGKKSTSKDLDDSEDDDDDSELEDSEPEIKKRSGSGSQSREKKSKGNDVNCEDDDDSLDNEESQNPSSGSQNTHTVYIGNLPFDASEEDMQKALKPYGKYAAFRFPKNPTGKSKGFCFVEYRTEKEATTLSKQNIEIRGRELKIRMDSPNQQSRPNDGADRRGPRTDFVERPQSPPSNTLFIGNLSYETKEDELRKKFSVHGTVSAVRLITNKDTGRSKGTCYVEFDSVSSAKKAFESMKGKEIGGRSVKIDFAFPRKDGPPPANKSRFGGFNKSPRDRPGFSGKSTTFDEDGSD